MARSNFSFNSPKVEFRTIDRTGRTNLEQPVGPIVIGRAERGPAMIPLTTNDEAAFRTVFGNPIPGGAGGDIWRDGNKTAPTYGSYAANAWLKNENPCTFVRLLGFQHSDATTAGKAGWETQDSSGTATGLGVADSNGGAYGLFICDSASYAAQVTGTLAAVFYLTQGSITLSGSHRGEVGGNITGSAVMIGSVGVNQEFKAIIKNSSGVTVKETAFNFSENSERYIRKVFNTNPTLTNSSITNSDDLEVYWLGESYEKAVADTITSSSVGGNWGILLGLKGDTAAKEGSDHRFGSVVPQTGWIISQDLTVVSGAANSFNPENMTKLFKFHGLHTAEWEQSNVKVSIEDVRASANDFNPYGTFTVTVRKVDDFDNSIKVIERYAGLDLNPNSNNFIGRRIGDKYLVWDESQRRYDEFGDWDNNSSMVRVELNSTVRDATADPLLLPYGFFGPVRHKGFALVSGSTDTKAFGSLTTSFTGSFVKGSGSIARSYPLTNATGFFADLGVSASFTGSFLFPSLPLRTNSNQGDLANPREAFFGITSDFTAGSKFNKGYGDLVRSLPAGYNTFTANTQETEYAFIFTLDDIAPSGGTHGAYTSGSRAAGTSLTAVSGTYKAVLDKGFDSFTMPLYGAFDGIDITEREPFRNTLLEGGTETTNYAYNSVKRAIDSVSDAEEVETKLLVVPGLTNEALTSHVVNTAELRGDALAIIDLKGGYQSIHESTATEANRVGSYSTAITNLRQRGLNSEFGCAYYPWLRYRDEDTGRDFWGPPSIAALGTMATTEAEAELWFAPAGFNRGDLAEGKAGGIPVIGVREKLRVKERDELYLANVNPITKGPRGRIVVFGQKTLLLTPSALDRINVKRLQLHIRRELTRMATTLLFDPNIRVTWNKFLNRAQPFLDSLITRFGLESASLVLDETTTTADLRDRNIAYAKVAVVPTKAIEAFFIDFELNESGVSF